MILIRQTDGNIRKQEERVSYYLLPGEVIVGSERELEINQQLQQETHQLQEWADTNSVGVGDLIAAVTKTTGFQDWWNAKHKGQCIPCKRRQAVYNYVQFAGPNWLKKWVEANDS